MTHRSPLTCIAIVLLFVGVTGGRGALAQYDDLLILSDETVRDELKLNDEQRGAAEGLRDARAKEWKDWFEKHYLAISREERNKAVRERRDAFSVSVAQKYHAMLNDTLQPAQLERLREIVIQLRSTSLALMLRRNPEIVESLQITEEQLRKINLTGNRDEAIEAFHLQGEERTKALREWGEKRNKEILDIFTAAQRAKLETSKGTPFDLSSLNAPAPQRPE